MNLPAVLLFICFSTAYASKRLKCKQGGDNLNLHTLSVVIEEPIKTEECEDRHGPEHCARVEFNNSETGRTGTHYYCHYHGYGPCDHLTDSCRLQTGKLHNFNGKWNQCCSSSGNFTNLTSIFPSAGSLSPTSSALLQSSSSAPEKSDNTGLFIGIGVGVGVLLILLIVAAILVYCFCCKKKKPSGGKATTGDGGKMKNGKTPKPAVESHYV